MTIKGVPSNGVLTDNAGNLIDTHLSADGDYHLGVSLEQNVIADTGNSSTTNLASGATFTGTGRTTLGVVGLQWSLKTDQNCEVCVEESPDNTNWDIVYCFDYIASKGGRGETVQATQAFWRLRVTNSGVSTTSYFRLQGVLCPIAVPLPSELSHDGRLKSSSTITGSQNEDRHAWISPLNQLTTSPQYRLAGKSFSGATKDTNFWTEAVTNGGTVDQVPGEVKLTTNTTANGTARYTSVRKARFVAGNPNMFTGGISFKTALTAGNVRRVGAYNGTEGVDGDGYYFELDESTFSVTTRKAGTDTRITNGNFNGHYGVNWTPVASTYYKLDIEMTPMATFYYIDTKLLHKTAGGHQTGTITLPITMECNNSGGATADIEMHCVGAIISRLGQIITNPTYKHIASNDTYICKYGAGKLHGIAINDPSAACTLTIYDNTSATGTIIGIMALTTKVITPFYMNYQLPFFTGLTIVTSANSDFTIIYE